jgi:DNA (cytosine-5)-methyltransferase 1
MKFGSVCSGIEAASVAWHPLGWKAAWLSEIEPFPSAVLKHHYPDVPNLGDMTTLPERILSGEVDAPDVFCGGTPCQAFSVAGLRKSLDDARGNLSLTFVGIANAIDHVRSVRSDAPAIIFWENVPGVLNTKDNAFGCFLGALAGEDEPLLPAGGRWTNAGCVFGPQRTVAWRVLDAQYFGVAQRRRRVFVVASARDGFNPAEVLFEFESLRRDTAPSREARKEVTECAGTLTANGGGLNRPAGNANELDFCVTVDTAKRLTAGSGQRYDFETDTFLAMRVEPIAPALTASNDPSRSPQSSEVTQQVAAVHAASMAVRRLTPVECERLQGFPDGYTNIPWRNKPESPDGPRYKALGNSWAVPVVAWIGKRIQEAIA